MKTLKERINEDFMSAFKNKEMDKKNFLGVIKGDIQNEEGRGIEPTDENVLKILKKTEKSLKESIKKGDESAKAELEILKTYLPELMSEEKIKEIVSSLVGEGKNNIGLIMKEFNTNYKGKADNSIVKEVALELLN
jgi:uncharacterized protein YqeY